MATLFAAAQRGQEGVYDEQTPLFKCVSADNSIGYLNKRKFSRSMPKTFDEFILVCTGNCNGKQCVEPVGVPQCTVLKSRKHFSVAIQGIVSTVDSHGVSGVPLDGDFVHLAPLPEEFFGARY